jgi:hypothetical protein
VPKSKNNDQRRHCFCAPGARGAKMKSKVTLISRANPSTPSHHQFGLIFQHSMRNCIHWLMTFSLHRMPNCSVLDVNVFLLASGEISFVCLCPLIRANLVLSILHSFPFCQKLVLVRSLNRGHKLNRTELHDIVNGVDREATPLGPPATPRMTQGFVRRMLEEELDVLVNA